MNRFKLRELLTQFLLEDLGDGDRTSLGIFEKDNRARGLFTAKADGIFSGVDVLTEGYALGDASIHFDPLIQDGNPVTKGQPIAYVEGSVIELLSRERVLLNLIQRMSGIATQTRQAVQLLNSAHTKICDTRKTMPGLRMLDKYAVTCGGGSNHRFGLFDGVMIKDNHIEHMGSLTKAIQKARQALGHMVKIEVETESRDQVLEAVEAGADVIMFDNRSPEEIKTFVQLVPEPIITEASGGITLQSLPDYSDTGVDYISLGALTHSVVALDISFNLLTRSDLNGTFRNLSTSEPCT